MARKRELIPFKPKRLIRLMNKQSISVKELGDRIGYTREHVSRTLHSDSINQNMLESISKEFNVSPDYLQGLINWHIDKPSLKKMHEHGEFPTIDEDDMYVESYDEYLSRIKFTEYIKSDIVGKYIKYLYETDNFVFSDGTPVPLEWMLEDKEYINAVIRQKLHEFLSLQDSSKPLVDHKFPPIE